MSVILPATVQPPNKLRLPVKSSGVRLRPPAMSSPNVLRVTNDLVRKNPNGFNLYGVNQDWIIQLPDDEPITRDLVIHGQDRARHIVIRGGAIQAEQRMDLTTMLLLDGSDYALYTRCGFTGATGGTFRVKLMESTYVQGLDVPYTAPIPYDADAATVKAAIQAALGNDAVFAVEPVTADTPGGPWKFVPGANAKMGRVSIEITGLTGGASLTTRTNVWNCAYGGLTLKQWKGTAHIEGVTLGGDFSTDGFRVQNPWDEAVVQLVNVHSECRFFKFNNDWNHPDGAQCYLGPTTLYAENCNFISQGGNGFIAQPRKAPTPRQLDGLRDWWFKDCLFRSVIDMQGDRIADASTALYHEHDWPSGGLNNAGFAFQMDNCFASRRLLGSAEEYIEENDLKYYNSYPNAIPSGLTLRASPVGGQFVTGSGLSYATSGYQPIAASPSMTKRLQGETLLT